MQYEVQWKTDKPAKKKELLLVDAISHYDAKRQFLEVKTPGTQLDKVNIKFLLPLVSSKLKREKKAPRSLPKDFDLNTYLRALEKLEVDRAIFR